ncbi:hypothetical protein RUM43_002511 [Polyplax serrata]|uniref:Uncharacterized protein n=1 Tax=Polyplax serrata TaxID=468196 RepID=A0AAN8NZA5_POLSC
MPGAMKTRKRKKKEKRCGTEQLETPCNVQNISKIQEEYESEKEREREREGAENRVFNASSQETSRLFLEKGETMAKGKLAISRLEKNKQVAGSWTPTLFLSRIR